MHFRSNWKLEVLVYEGPGGGGRGGMREREYRSKNFLEKGREITQRDWNKGHHGWKVHL